MVCRTGASEACRRIFARWQGQRLCSCRIFVECGRAGRQLNPRVPAAVVDGNLGWRKGRVRKCTHGDTHRFRVTLLGMKDGRPTDWAEPEIEPGPLIAAANVVGCSTKDLERGREAGQGREDTAGPLLASEAVADANASWLAIDLNAQLPAGTRGCSGRHQVPRRIVLGRPGDQIKQCLVTSIESPVIQSSIFQWVTGSCYPAAPTDGQRSWV